jgi:Holliday junction resolvasome RuvABC endonuclease subunit
MLLAFDLGTKCGWARGCAGKMPLYGTLDLSPGRFSGGGMRFLRFENELQKLLEGVQQVAFEEVRAHRGVDAAHIYGGLMATLTAQCERWGIPYEGIPVGSWKKVFVGKGNASKTDVVAEAGRRGYVTKTEDEADALGVWHAMWGGV